MRGLRPRAGRRLACFVRLRIINRADGKREEFMKLGSWCAAFLILQALSANAQRSNCPVRDAAIPRQPPGMPPDITPQISFPNQFGGEVKIEMPPPRPASNDLTAAEEGHLTAIARMADVARVDTPSSSLLIIPIDARPTLLSEWRFNGYYPERGHKVTQVFSRAGSVLVLEQWDYKADGITIFNTRQPSTAVGGFPARTGGLQTPSGCVAASLSWEDNETSFKLILVGPLPLPEQRQVLLGVAQSMHAVRSKATK